MTNRPLSPEKDVPVNLRADGVLWAINRVLFHPRGFALGYNQEAGTFVLLGDGTETWCYGPPVNEDEHYANFEALLNRARTRPIPSGSDQGRAS